MNEVEKIIAQTQIKQRVAVALERIANVMEKTYKAKHGSLFSEGKL